MVGNTLVNPFSNSLNFNRFHSNVKIPANYSLGKKETFVINHNFGFGNYKMIEIINSETNDAFLCAIILLKDSTLFVKLSLKIEGITEIKNEFITFCSSLNFD